MRAQDERAERLKYERQHQSEHAAYQAQLAAQRRDAKYRQSQALLDSRRSMLQQREAAVDRTMRQREEVRCWEGWGMPAGMPAH